MGTCQTRKLKQTNQDIVIVDKPKTEQKQSSIKLLLDQYHKLCRFLELIGNTDDLEKAVREKVHLLFITKSNIAILIQHDIKKIMKSQNIMKIVTLEDEALLYEDNNFLHRVSPQFQILMKLFDSISNDEEFENAFPILTHSFSEMNNELKKIKVQFNDTQTRQTTL